MKPSVRSWLVAIPVCSLLLGAGPAGAYRADAVARLLDDLDPSFTELAVRPLSSGRFVAAWAKLGEPKAWARVFDRDGSALTDFVPCVEDPHGLSMVGPHLVTTPDDKIVFGCDLGSIPHTTLRTYSAAMAPIGERRTYEDTFSILDGLEPADASSYFATVERCGTSCERLHERLNLDGVKIGSLAFPRFDRSDLTSRSNGELLVLGYSKPNPRGRRSLWWKLVTPIGQGITSARKVFKRREGELQIARAVSGVAGRTAVLIASLYRSYNKFRVLVIDANGESRTYQPEYLPGFTGVAYPPEAWALPLEHGFLILWSGQHSSGARRVWLQAFNENGTVYTEPTPVADPGVIAAPVLASDGQRYLVPIASGYYDATRSEVWRIGPGTACGDLNETGEMDDGDVSELLSVLSRGDTCDPCVCDVDGSGVVDFDDALVLARAAEDRLPLQCPVCSN